MSVFVWQISLQAPVQAEWLEVNQMEAMPFIPLLFRSFYRGVNIPANRLRLRIALVARRKVITVIVSGLLLLIVGGKDNQCSPVLPVFTFCKKRIDQFASGW